MPQAMYSFPQPQPPSEGSTPAHLHLPAQVTPLVGREREVENASALMRRADVRLLTLTGPGGVGKTRLSLQIAHEVVGDFPDGVYFVPLAPITDSGLVISAIAETLRVKEAGGAPLQEHLRSYLQPLEVLLLLDNFEQVTGAAVYVAELLSGCPNLKVIVTSRARLHLRGEHELAVPPLALPEKEEAEAAEALSRYESVRLFVQRAAALKPDFTLTEENARHVAQICRRVDGLPLAIELAAARVKLLTPRAILARLQTRLKLLTNDDQDLPERQQTMYSTIDWSYGLLDAQEKSLFRRAAVFAGGHDLMALEAVCGNVSGDTLDLVTELVDKSLLRQDAGLDEEPRFWMLETIREYALERLSEEGEEAQVKRTHALYYLKFAEETETELLGPDQDVWLKLLEVERSNLQAALEWATSAEALEDVEVGLRLSGALLWFWRMRSHLSEGRHWTAALLSRTEGAQTVARAKALHTAGWLAVPRGDYNLAQRLYEESLAIYRAAQDVGGIAATLIRLGTVASYLRDYPSARRLLQEGLAGARQVGDKHGIAVSLNSLGELARLEDDYNSAGALYEESLQVRREVGGKMGIAVALHNLAHVAHHQQDYGKAEALLMESATLFQKLGSTLDTATCIAGLAGVLVAKGQSLTGTRLLGAVGVVLDKLGATMWAADRDDYDRTLSAAHRQLGKEPFDSAWAEGSKMSLEQALLMLEQGTSPPSPRTHPAGLTERELEVLRLVAQGLTNAQVAQSLTISPNTVSIHLYSIYSKLGVKSRTAATRYGIEHGFLA